MSARYVAVKSDAIGKRWSAREQAFDEGMRMGSDDFLIATVEGGWMTDLTGAHGDVLINWAVEDDYQPVAAALGVTWAPVKP